MVVQPGNGAMPCAVETVVKSGCQTCHGAVPIGGAPMSLLTHADFMRDYTVKTTTQLRGQTMKMYELSRIRLNREMGTTPMPQGTTLATDAFSTLDGWLRGGATPGMGCAVAQGGSNSVPPVGGSGGGMATGWQRRHRHRRRQRMRPPRRVRSAGRGARARPAGNS